MNIKDLFQKLGDVDEQITGNIRRITDWDETKISSFLEKDINSNLTEEEYHAIGYYYFMYPGKVYFAEQLKLAGQRIKSCAQEEREITPEDLIAVRDSL